MTGLAKGTGVDGLNSKVCLLLRRYSTDSYMRAVRGDLSERSVRDLLQACRNLFTNLLETCLQTYVRAASEDCPQRF